MLLLPVIKELSSNSEFHAGCAITIPMNVPMTIAYILFLPLNMGSFKLTQLVIRLAATGIHVRCYWVSLENQLFQAEAVPTRQAQSASSQNFLTGVESDLFIFWIITQQATKRHQYWESPIVRQDLKDAILV
jgi:hypothetical protein